MDVKKASLVTQTRTAMWKQGFLNRVNKYLRTQLHVISNEYFCWRDTFVFFPSKFKYNKMLKKQYIDGVVIFNNTALGSECKSL